MFAGENVSGASSLRFGRLDDAEKPGAGADAGSFTSGASPTADLTPSFREECGGGESERSGAVGQGFSKVKLRFWLCP